MTSQMGTGTNTLSSSWYDIHPIAGGRGATAVLKQEHQADFNAFVSARRAEAVEAARQRAAQAPEDRAPQLTEAELKDLASRYDPSHMTQEEYAALVDELCNKGILDPEDKDLLGANTSGMVRLDWDSLSTASCVSAAQAGVSFFPDAGGDLFSFARHQSSFRFMDPVSGSWYQTKTASLYETLADILGQMRSAASM